ncbi:hypothetical protein J2Y45_000013 [Dyadobacter sp. BE34]|uniref:DUF2029 domain-containing protein n=1 Tax=Dyadobacter fermentans TaxID=94254 RepID=A0ABU1R9I1_9BACT|nr:MULTISPECIES: hypothetical protein [Dyadobacter]MDR6809260.1 hypothetical protein [Dyadobacter fermentans]MDR7047146.1 hypothetical protein [Dyadobacter sp. BE242]MDR7194887.1 hypothetical protein [Dyadobacter sp. BE34]MDR7214568.1 hypothetical protein [Dyadobacter sp. BE31]MDR7266809.1 hypothetical protein [Dyadobacter sp. BE32]
MNIVLAKTAISVAALLVTAALLFKRESLTDWLEKKSANAVMAVAWIFLRLLPFIAVYLIANMEPTSDVNGFWDEGSKASLGQVVYRDFWSPYSPLYAYFLGIWLKLWYSPKMIVLTMAAMDGIALLVSYHFFRPFQSRGTFLFRALVYLLLPGSLVLCVIGAQEDVWMWLFVILAYLLRERTLRVEWYAVILAVGLLMTKAIFVLIMVPLFLLEKQKIRFVIPIAIIGIISLAVLYPLVGLEFMQPLDEAKTLRAPNIPSVLNPWFYNSIGVGEKIWNWIGLVASVGLACISAWRLRNADFRVMLSKVWVVLYATMMIVQQSAYSNYIFLFLLPLVFYVIDWKNKTQVTILFVFNLLCVVHPSYWWRLGMPCYLTPSDPTASSELLIDYLMQTAIVILTGYFIWLAFPKKNEVTSS